MVCSKQQQVFAFRQHKQIHAKDRPLLEVEGAVCFFPQSLFELFFRPIGRVLFNETNCLILANGLNRLGIPRFKFYPQLRMPLS